MNAKTMEKAKAHGKILIRVFKLPKDTDPILLCKRLRKIETSLNRLYTRECNGELEAGEEVKVTSQCRRALEKLSMSNRDGIPRIFFNSDPRGYALKVPEDEAGELPRDWGNYGLVAPDLTEVSR